ncbi:MAG TPA: ABC transporter permease subunit [Thermomicrobiaceae bacterium]|nr:ABC transporter permease subunit [Thermomicrobiaceae bacterium]
MSGSIAAELLVLRKRVAPWVLLGVWVTLALTFAYLLPYLTYEGRADFGSGSSLAPLLPQGLAGTLIGGFPFYGGTLALMLGVLSVGSDFGWDTFKTLFTQGPSRLRVFAAKLIALGIALVPFVLLVYGLGALSAVVIAEVEHAPIVWPGAGLLLRALLASWFIVAVWAAFGVLLAVLTRGTALAIGLGILWILVIEGLVGALFNEFSLLRPLVQFFIRANAYSLGQPLGAAASSAASGGPGTFAGPFVGAEQALLVLLGYFAAFLLLAGLMLRRRDVA